MLIEERRGRLRLLALPAYGRFGRDIDERSGSCLSPTAAEAGNGFSRVSPQAAVGCRYSVAIIDGIASSIARGPYARRLRRSLHQPHHLSEPER